jgi:fructosamine-3-kinase
MPPTTAVSFVLLISLIVTAVHGRHAAFVSNPHCVKLCITRLFSEPSLMDCISAACSQALGTGVVLEPTSASGAAAGGGGASVGAAVDKVSGTKYFIKSAPAVRYGTMLRAEYLGVQEMANTNTIKVPTPIAYGQGGPLNTAFVVFEYLEMSLGGSAYELGQHLAQMHRFSSNITQFGFHVDNTIGATPQPNPWTDDWADFWEQHRLGHMLGLLDNLGYSDKDVATLKAVTRQCLSHKPPPSLIHGDLWGGNKGYCRVNGANVPVIFDPATYYGDREADVAMTGLFGGFGPDFYKGYESVWPLESGYEERKKIYNLYHIMNHVVLFGGGYRAQARGMMEEIMRFKI